MLPRPQRSTHEAKQNFKQGNTNAYGEVVVLGHYCLKKSEQSSLDGKSLSAFLHFVTGDNVGPSKVYRARGPKGCSGSLRRESWRNTGFQHLVLTNRGKEAKRARKEK